MASRRRGVLTFSTIDEAADAARQLELDYERHSRAARAIAEEYFEASKVMARLVADAGWA